MKNKLYITYCSNKKFPIIEGIPERLYDSTRIQSFIRVCKLTNVDYGILSGKYGIVKNDTIIQNYDTLMPTIYDNEYEGMVSLIQIQLHMLSYREIVYYVPNEYRAKRYVDILKDSCKMYGILLTLINHLSDIHNYTKFDI